VSLLAPWPLALAIDYALDGKTATGRLAFLSGIEPTKLLVLAAATAVVLTIVGGLLDIGRLPHGYDTPLGESGVRLSGGQRRRVAIARAAVSKAPMVLLDEPTASLDPRSAAAVIDAIRTATTNRTVLVVTHDRDLAAIADRVVTLSPAPRGRPGNHRSTDLQQDGRR
jgi:ABC-type bacteriocin/lantibiotic exporter with double-glycine peptidase domain